MGFNTTVLILNDAFDQIEKHPEQFVDQLSQHVKGGKVYRHPMSSLREVGEEAQSFAVGNHGNAASVIEVQHADFTQVILAGGNHATLLGEVPYAPHHTRDGVKETLNAVLKQYGLKVIEAKKK